jgi:large subunit ribosomal protein LP0
MVRKHHTPPTYTKTLNAKQFRVSLDLFDRVIVVKVDGASNEQVSAVRKDLGDLGILMMCKRSCILAGLEDYIQENKEKDTTQYKVEMLATLPNYLKGEVGIMVTNMSIEQVDLILSSHTLHKRANKGKKTRVDIMVKKQYTEVEPSKTFRFASVNISTRVVRGRIEILEDTLLCKKRDVITADMYHVLELLNMKPETCAIEMLQIFEPGLSYAVKDMMPLVESRVEEAMYEFLCFGLGAGQFTYIEKISIPDSDTDSEDLFDFGDDADIFGLFD